MDFETSAYTGKFIFVFVVTSPFLNGNAFQIAFALARNRREYRAIKHRCALVTGIGHLNTYVSYLIGLAERYVHSPFDGFTFAAKTKESVKNVL